MVLSDCSNQLFYGNEYLHELGLLEHNFAYNILGLAAIAFVTLAFAYVGLRLVTWDK